MAMVAMLAALSVACRGRRAEPSSQASADAGRDGAAPQALDASADARLGPPAAVAIPRRGMAWIPPGALVAGTAPDARPRIADQEMPGEQVILKGYYIDLYPYPNEEGAIPQTSLTQAEAQALCDAQDKRLCTELEWERACKGPDNRAYEYGDRYQAGRCETGRTAKLVPSGLNAGCVSDFGVHDLHGGVWEWTSSPWGRGDSSGLATVRGGNGVAGEVVARCAHAQGRRPSEQSGVIGFRCCAGPENNATVTLNVVRGKKLEAREHVDKKVLGELVRALPPEAHAELGGLEDLRWQRHWIWHPIGNEELVVAGGCTGLGIRPACGILIARMVLDRAAPIAWVSSGRWVPMVHADVDPRDIWLFGGDQLGQFRALLSYRSGDIRVGPRERRVPHSGKKHLWNRVSGSN